MEPTQALASLSIMIVVPPIPIIGYVDVDEARTSSKMGKGLVVSIVSTPKVGASSSRPTPKWLIRVVRARKGKSV